MEQALTLQKVTKVFNRNKPEELVAIRNISLEIFKGEFFIFVGPSGSGKSTLLRMMSGLESDYEGTITYAPGIGLHNISFVFQQFALLPWLTVFQNIELGLIPKSMSDDERAHLVREELKRLGLEKFSKHYPRELSGGTRQRVGIARALVTHPTIMFMDEPFSELDSFTATELRKEILNIWEEKKMTIILVSHNIEESLELADRIAVLTPSPGKLEKIVQNTLPRPRQKRSQDFFRLEDEIYKAIKG